MYRFQLDLFDDTVEVRVIPFSQWLLFDYDWADLRSLLTLGR